MAIRPAWLLVWLGSSAAALATVFAAAGFLAVSAHETMLGTSDLQMTGVLDDPSSYVYAGARFFADTLRYCAVSFIKSLYPWLAVASIAALLFVASSSANWLARRPDFSLVAGTILILVALFVLAAEFLSTPLLGQGLLYQHYSQFAPRAQKYPVLEALRQASEADGSDVLKVLKVRQAVLTWWVIVCAFLIRWMAELYEKLKPAPQGSPSLPVMVWRFGRWFVLAFFLLTILLLPMHYGAVALDYTFPSVEDLTLSDGEKDTKVRPATKQNQDDLSTPLLLLRDDGECLTLFNPRNRTVLRLRQELVKDYIVGTPQTIFPTLGKP